MLKAHTEIKLANWEDFSKLVTKLEIGDPLKQSYIHRGQADAEWELLPSLVRHASKSGLSAEDTVELETSMLRGFQREAHLYLPPRKVHDEKEITSWWMLMQHYGAPTRVLDWTRSPFVALYFAVEQELGKDGAVWTFHPHTVDEHMGKTFSNFGPPTKLIDIIPHYTDRNAEERLYLLEPKTQTDRMAAQQIAFTVSQKVLADHGQIIWNATAERTDMSVYIKITIPANFKPVFLRRLREMNVTARTLFPGIDGLGKSAAELVKLKCWYASTDKGAGEKK